jgi:hypothetical protein
VFPGAKRQVLNLGCSYKSGGQDVSLNPGETKEDGKLTHLCESKDGTLQARKIIQNCIFHFQYVYQSNVLNFQFIPDLNFAKISVLGKRKRLLKTRKGL